MKKPTGRQFFLAALFLFFLTVFFTGCNGVYYLPDKIEWTSLNEIPKDKKPDVFSIETAGGAKLNAWHFSPRKVDPKRNETVIVHFHGNAQNLTSHFLQLFWLGDEGYHYLIADYRGYGKSDGEVSRQHVYEDVQSVIRYAQAHYKNVILYGQSLGGAAALGGFQDLKDRSHIKAIVIEASFASYQRIGRRKLAQSWVTWPLQWLAYILVTDTYAPHERVKEVSPIPLIVVHGDDDRTVEFIEGQDLFAEAIAPKEFITVDKADHLQCLNDAKTREHLLNSFDQATSK